MSGFRLTSRDGLILKAVNDYQALSIELLQRLFWNSSNPAYTTVRRLVKHGYLVESYITQVRAAPGASPRVFTISPLGAAVLCDTYGYTKSEINYLSREVNNWQTLQPILATNAIRAAIDRACRDSGQFTLSSWILEKEFRREVDTVLLDGKPTPLYPDGFFTIETDRIKSNIFLEVDNGTEGLAQFKSQMSIYQAYILSGRYERRFQAKSLRIAVVTKSKRRLEALRTATKSAGGSERYWFTTADEVTAQTALTSPIWKRTIGDELLPLFNS